MPEKKQVYSLPLYYDVAFDFRNIPAQADFIEEVFQLHTGRQLSSMIELGCGPGYFVAEFHKRGKRSIGLDNSQEMIEYAREKMGEAGITPPLILGDMIDFGLEEKVDLAILMLDSISHVTSNDDFLRHLESVSRNLNTGGLYLIEFSHPSSVLSNDARCRSNWKSRRGKIRVETTWGAKEDVTDPITQVTQTSVLLEVDDNGKSMQFTDRFPQKCYTAQEVLTLIRLSGVFDFADWYGDFDFKAPLDNSKKSWRMIIALRKR